MELEVGWSRKGIFIKIVQNALTWESPQAFKRYWSIAFILVQLKIQQKFTSLRVQAPPPEYVPESTHVKCSSGCTVLCREPFFEWLIAGVCKWNVDYCHTEALPWTEMYFLLNYALFILHD